ncbi:MAG TPA: ABC transporter substrate-binding protein [Burkholderiaceae bacterium]|nr:ABC transporter substrate-binding protein [Burkholderiaceae bacterium]
MMNRLHAARVQAGVIAAAVLFSLTGNLAAAQGEPPKPDRIVMNDAGGATQAANRKTFYNAFEKKYGITIVNTSPVDLGKLRAMVTSGNIEWTVTEIAGPDAILAERSGLLEPLDHSVIDLSNYPEHLRDRKYVFPKSAYSTIIGYRSDVFGEGKGPQSWADFWDVKKFPGPRTMQNSPVENLEFALLADGVAPENLYPLDVDRAFKKMDEIKPHVAVWWTTGAQSAQLLVDQEAVIGTAWNGRYYSLIKEGAPISIVWNQGAIKESAFGIPKGAKDAYWGQRLLAVTADAKLQGEYANIIGYPGLNLEATKHTDPKLLPYLPTSPENLSKQFWVNLEWWSDNRAAIQERWMRWLLQ